MSIEERLARVERILDARGLDWDHPKIDAGEKPEPPPAKPKRWRYREKHEIVQPGDWANSVDNRTGDWPPAAGWIKTSRIGKPVSEFSNWLRIACEVTDDAYQSDQSPDDGEKVAEEPVEEPQPEPPEPEYREPVLPGDAEKQCEFSDHEGNWYTAWLSGWKLSDRPWISDSGANWRYARIRKDA